MKNKKIRYILVILAVVIFISTLVIILTFKGRGRRESKDVIKVGFIMSGSNDEEGWNGLHYDGIYSACEELDIELIIKENILHRPKLLLCTPNKCPIRFVSSIYLLIA